MRHDVPNGQVREKNHSTKLILSGILHNGPCSGAPNNNSEFSHTGGEQSLAHPPVCGGDAHCMDPRAMPVKLSGATDLATIQAVETCNSVPSGAVGNVQAAITEGPPVLRSLL